MVLLGTIVNSVAIIIAALVGTLVRNIPDQTKTTIMQALAIAIIVLGMTMAFKTEQFLIMIGSLVVGALIGEKLDIEGRLNQFGMWVEKRVGSNTEGSVAKAFVTSTLVYVVGAMAILGSLDSGLRGDHSILFTKAMLDGFTAVIFASTLGIGVIFSAIPVFLYQGGIALFATQINQYIPEALMNTFITEMTAIGGVMIVAIGLNILQVVQIRVGNLLPGIVVVGALVSVSYFFI